MAFNPMSLMKLKDRFHLLKSDHPKLVPFFQMLKAKALEEGTILEIKAKTKDGQEYTSNIKLTQNDVETLKMFIK